MRALFLTVAALAPLATTLCPAAQPATRPASAQILHLRVAREIPQPLRNLPAVQSLGLGNSSRPNVIEMLLAVHLPDRNILSLPPDALRIDRFVDDKDRDLTRTNEREYYYNNYGSYRAPNVSPDGHFALLPIATDRTPAPEATTILLRGSLRVRTFDGEATSPRQPLPVRVGKKLDAGGHTLTLRSITSQDPAGQQLRLTFSSDKPVDAIKAIRFFDPKTNDELRTTNLGRSEIPRHQPEGPAPTYSIICGVAGQPDDVLVEVDSLQNVQEVSIPLEVKADLGTATAGTPVPGPEQAATKTNTPTR